MKKNNTYRLNLLAVFTAIIILQTSIPILGLIPIGPLSITIIPVTIAIVAIVMSPMDGAIIGGVWGLITFIRAYVWPTSPMATIVFVNPLVSVFPRIMVGVVAGIVYQQLKHRIKSSNITISLAAIAGSLTNTILVLGLIYLLYRGNAPQLYAINVKNLLPYLLGVIGTNGVPEAIFAGIVTPIIAKPLLKATSHRSK